MKIKNIFLMLSIASFACLSVNAEKKTIALAGVTVSESIKDINLYENKELSLKRVMDGIDGQLIDALNGTRKFNLVSRMDTNSILEELSLHGESFSAAKADYIVVLTIDDFQDFFEKVHFEALGKHVEKRKIRLGMIAKILEMDGSVIESTNFQLDNTDINPLIENSYQSGDLSDDLIRKITKEMALKISNRVIDVIFPAKILAINGSQVTINRGDGTGIVKEENWNVFALGEELVDPDTGESLGKLEFNVGKIKINNVTPKFSQGTIIEDYGITKGSILRKSEQ